MASILGGDKGVKRNHSQDSTEGERKKVKTTEEEKEEDDDDEEEEEEKDEDAINLVESAPRIKIHTLDTVESCTHEVAVPPGNIS